MGFGFGVLRLSPESFWRMTPRELAAAMEAVLGTREAALDRASFAELSARFPDAPSS
ncbi:MAG: phage tail assembly chaperone [Alphaproteobacteria bacterium]|nr:MAG: phage tail assembly chaperone [Alphaproteobacteria bacterium]